MVSVIFKTVRIRALKETYPPANHWVYETGDIKPMTLQNPVDPKKPLHLIDTSKLVHGIKENENIVFIGNETEELVGIVGQSLLAEPGLEWVEAAVDRHIRLAEKKFRSLRVIDAAPNALLESC